jgi:phenylalanyl-tRNA synthetase alpha chain
MEEKLTHIRKNFLDACTQVNDFDKIEELRIEYLGRKGKINGLFKEIAEFPLEQKKVFGGKINALKKEIQNKLTEKKKTLETKKKEDIDLLLPGRTPGIGHRHVLTHVFNELITFFTHYGFSIATGPEIEFDWYNFGALNMAKDHPARDMYCFAATPHRCRFASWRIKNRQ